MRAILAPLMAGVLAFGAVAPAAFADPPRYNHSRDWNDRDYRNDRGRHDNRRDRDRYNGRGWYDYRGSHHDWRRGDRFDRRYYTSYRVVNDYRYYRLAPPRRGEYYYRDDRTGEILLIAAATGLVLWALNNNY